MFDSFEFVNLEIGPEEPSANNDENEGFITFKVTLKARVDNPSYSTLAGQETKVSERSRFIREDGVWSYASGDVQSDAAGLEDTKLNA